MWGIARRTSTVYDRFQAYESAATLTVFGCQEGITLADIEANGYQLCTGYDYADLREFLATVPEVEAARWTLAISRVAAADDPDRGWRQLVPVPIDPEAVPVFGRPIIVDGRLADPAVGTEATINEEEARVSVWVSATRSSSRRTAPMSSTSPVRARRPLGECRRP